MHTEFPEIAALFSDMLEKAYKIAGKRKKNAYGKVVHSKISWGPTHEAAFGELKETLQYGVKLAKQEEEHKISVLRTRRKNSGLASSHRQKRKKMQKKESKQNREPPPILGRQFNETKLN